MESVGNRGVCKEGVYEKSVGNKGTLCMLFLVLEISVE